MEKELRVRFTGDAQDLRRAAQDAERAMREVERTQDQTGLSAAELGKKLGGLAAAYLSLQTAAMAAQKGLQGLASIEQSELTFKVLFGSAEQAKAKMQELVQFAAQTPFELPGIVEAAKKLETFGLSSTKYLKDAGDLAAAFNVEISEVAGAMGRLNSGDFGEAFERLRDFGIARKDLEGEGLVFDKSGSYQGSVDQALTAVQAIIRKKFGGMMDEQSKTFNGQMSTLADGVQEKLNKAFTGTFDVLKEEATKTNEALKGELGKDLDTVAHAFGGALADALKTASVLAGDVGHVLLAGAKAYANAITAARFEMAKHDRKPFQQAMQEGLKSAYPGWEQHGGTGPNVTRPDDRLVGFNALVKRGADAKSLQSYINTNFPGTVAGSSDIEFRKKLYKLVIDAQTEATGKIQQSLEEIVSGGMDEIDKAVKEAQNRKPSNTGGTTTGAAARASKTVDSWVDAVVDQSVDALELRLSGLLNGKSQGVTSATSRLSAGLVRGQNYGMGLGFTGLDTRLNDAMQTPSGVLGLVDPGSDSRAEELGERIERETKAYVAKQEQARKEADRLAEDLHKKSEDALRSGLEAGVAGFLDGGLQGFGNSLQSYSKQAFGKSLVDGIMGDAELKKAFGGLGEALGGAAGISAALAIGSVIWDAVSKVKTIFDDSQAFNDAKGTRNSIGSLKSASTVFKNTPHVSSSHLAGLSNEISRAEKQVEVDLALGKITETQAQAAREQINAAKQLLDASKNQFDAAEQLKKSSAEDKQDWRQIFSQDFKEAVAKAQGRDLEAEDIGGWISRQQEWLATNTKGNSRLADVAEGGFSTDEIIGLIGDGKNNRGTLSKQDEWLRQELRDLLIAQVNLGDRGGATQSVGSMSSPDNALAFDAPVNRTVNNAFNIGIQTYAITGDKASIKDLARIMAVEIANIQGQAV